MKIVGRATLWLIDKLVYLLIGKKDFTPTPVPDDWPPDGSMHFLRFDHPIGLTGLPPNAVQYEFAANVGEDDPVVFSLGQEIISRLCDSRKTLIVFSFDHELPKNKRQGKNLPTSEYVTQFLRTLVPEVHIVQKENTVVFLFTGCPKNLFSQYHAASDLPSYFIDFYLFTERTMPCCPEEAISLIEKGCYQTNLYLGYGPNALNIVFDPKSLDITEAEKVIEEVCHSHNIQLINPFSKTT
nr:hypothetical protein [uncultured Oscillibacter sp.]